MNKELKTAEEIQNQIDDAADKYGFQVPYDGTNNFYNHDKVKSFQDGAKFALHIASQLPPITKEQAEKIWEKKAYVVDGGFRIIDKTTFIELLTSINK